MDIRRLKEQRAQILDHAEGLVLAATLTVAPGLEHVRYHLAALALEEVGKAGMLSADTVTRIHGPKAQPTALADQVEDHVRKLHWALWTAAFGNKKYSAKDFEADRAFALEIHRKRLATLYSDPQSPKKIKISAEEAGSLLRLARARLEFERLHEFDDKGDFADVVWFLHALEHPERRLRVFSEPSMEKLRELDDAKTWAIWLRKWIEDEERALRRLAENEIARILPDSSDSSGALPKWQIRFRIYSHSHSVRQSALNAWNKEVDWLKLTSSGKRVFSRTKKDEIICDATMPQSVGVSELWHRAWSDARAFVVALNIATGGYFWWYVPADTDGWYDKIIDLETDTEVRISDGPSLRVEWGNHALSAERLNTTALLFGFLNAHRGHPLEVALGSYAAGLASISKIDFHWRTEWNTLSAFWSALKEALRATSAWDGVSDLSIAIRDVFQNLIDGELGQRAATNGLELDRMLKSGQEPSRRITLADVIEMKMMSDIYFVKIANRWGRAQIEESPR